MSILEQARKVLERLKLQRNGHVEPALRQSQAYEKNELNEIIPDLRPVQPYEKNELNEIIAQPVEAEPAVRVCAQCGHRLDAKGCCWRCCDRPCEVCGQPTGSAFIRRCWPCGLREDDTEECP